MLIFPALLFRVSVKIIMIHDLNIMLKYENVVQY